jgi:hypothetical protein
MAKMPKLIEDWKKAKRMEKKKQITAMDIFNSRILPQKNIKVS